MAGLVFVVSGPSGSGKNTLIDYLMESSGGTLVHSVSATSRQPRPKELDGIHYYFKTREEFEKMRDNNELLEWDEFRGNYYGTVIADIDEKLKKELNVTLDITVPGAENIRKIYGNASTLVFLVPPSVKILRKRLLARNSDSVESIEKRIEFALTSELSMFEKFDYVIVNDNLRRAKKKILCIYKAANGDKKAQKKAEKFLVTNCKAKINKKIEKLLKEAKK